LVQSTKKNLATLRLLHLRSHHFSVDFFIFHLDVGVAVIRFSTRNVRFTVGR
jgi:hypothetical protein